MPWTVSDVNRHKKGLSPRKKRQWVYVANSALKRGLDEGAAIRMANSTVNRTKAISPNIGGGVDRNELKDSDFAIPGERKFPVVIPKDVKDAVSSWGRYKGPVDFETFKKNLTALAKRKGADFVKALPASWGIESAKAARYAHIDFSPPESARLAAKRGLELRAKFKRGGTAIGVARARDLSNGSNISPNTIGRMRSYFARHAVDKRAKDWGNASNPSAGYVAWLLWGGDAGQTWANKVYRQMQAADKDGITTKAEANTSDGGKKPSGGGKGYGARKGEVIRGNLARGEGGKFVAAGNAPAASAPTVDKPKTKPTAGYKPPVKPGATKKPAAKKSPAVNAAQREAERQKLRAKREAERQADRAKREAERQADRAKRAAEREADRQKKAAAAAGKTPKPAKGGAGGESKQTAAQKRKQQQADNRKRVVSEMESKGGLPSKLAESLIDLFEGDSPSPTDLEALVAEGVAKKTDQGAYILSPAGVTYVHSLNKGNAEAATRALERARKSKTSKKEFSPGLTVFKDVNGQYRWVLYSSNAYKDRDGEIISEQALKAECARTDKDGMYGPLRWWHVGKPDPIKYPESPWGPGADLGMCDFRAMRGRVLIESGTFKSERIGEAVARLQDDLRGSIGLMHPITEPIPEDGAHVFRNIFIFERSLLPAGKESNPFTRVYVYDERKRKMEQKKLEALRSLVGDGIASEILNGADATQKEADAAGVLYKEQQTANQLDAVLAAFGTALKQILQPASVAIQPESPTTSGAVQETEKAATEPEMAAKADGEEMTEEMVEESEGDMGEEIETYIADMTVSEFRDMLTSAFQEAVSPLVDLETKMRGLGDGMKGNAMLLEELKAALGMTRKKEADVESAQVAQAQEIATLKQSLTQQIADLQKQLADIDTKTKELAGEVPNGFNNMFGFIASRDASTVLQETVKEEVSQYPTPDKAVDNFVANLTRGVQTNGH